MSQSIPDMLRANGEIPCKSCPRDFPFPATHIANAHGGNRGVSTAWDWPLCASHVEHGMVAGWFPIRGIDEAPSYDPEPRVISQ